jgi:AraC-like DNA-binding protein
MIYKATRITDDAARDIIDSTFPGLKFDFTIDKDPRFWMDFASSNTGRVQLSATKCSHVAHMVSGIEEQALDITFLRSGTTLLHYNHGKPAVEVKAGDCIIGRTRLCKQRDVRPGRRLHIRVTNEVLNSFVVNHFQVMPEAPVEFAEVFSGDNLTVQRFRQLSEIAFAQAFEAEPWHRSIIEAQFEQIILSSLLLNIPHSLTATLASASRPAGPGYVRRALDYMRAALEESITLEDIAAAAGCSPRTLQLAFRDRYGMSSMKRLKHFSLKEAEQRLRSGKADSIIDVAFALGFYNLGRFASDFRQTFGTLPSEVKRKQY